jgi:hypothetical protein
MSMKNSNDTIGNRTRDLPACSAVPQPTATPRASIFYSTWEKLQQIKSPFMKKMRADWLRDAPAIILCGIFCFHVCHPEYKIKKSRNVIFSGCFVWV